MPDKVTELKTRLEELKLVRIYIIYSYVSTTVLKMSFNYMIKILQTYEAPPATAHDDALGAYPAAGGAWSTGWC